MAMKKRTKNDRWKRLRARRDDPETTRQYTTDDFKSLVADKKSGNGEGILRPSTNDYHLGGDLEDIGEGQKRNEGPKVVLVITILALIFISIIAYLVSQMPAKD
jgi:hypothetical protein